MTSGLRLRNNDQRGLSSFGYAAVTVCWIGIMRPASGSWGSLPPVALVLLLVWCGVPWWVVVLALALMGTLATAACIRYGEAAEVSFASKDPSSVVADETAGCAVTLLAVPWWMILNSDEHAFLRAVIVCATGFFFFRLFDVWKPGFVSDLQKQPFGWGIVLDDLAAGAWAWPPVILSAAAALRVYPLAVS